MRIFELIILAIALAMDAFAVSICKGLATHEVKLRHMCIAGAWFGGFQALMPLIGYLLGGAFEQYITAVDHWIAFLLLAFIGIRMIYEARSGKEEATDDCFGVKTMFVMAVATSIDALAVGVSLALIPDVNIALALTLIGVVTFVLSAAGVKIGNAFGARYKSRAEIAGGVMLVLIGLKILLSDYGVIPF